MVVGELWRRLLACWWRHFELFIFLNENQWVFGVRTHPFIVITVLRKNFKRTSLLWSLFWTWLEVTLLSELLSWHFAYETVYILVIYVHLLSLSYQASSEYNSQWILLEPHQHGARRCVHDVHKCGLLRTTEWPLSGEAPHPSVFPLNSGFPQVAGLSVDASEILGWGWVASSKCLLLKSWGSSDPASYVPVADGAVGPGFPYWAFL